MDGGIGLEITRSLISDAIKRIHADGVNRVFTHGSYPQMPNIDCLEANKTQFWQFGAIFEDEGTIKGTYGVHTSIFIDQLGLRAPDDPNEAQASDADDFRDRLFLVHGDQLTAHHIRSVKAEQSKAIRPFDRRDWVLGIPAWFHIHEPAEYYHSDTLGPYYDWGSGSSLSPGRYHHMGSQFVQSGKCKVPSNRTDCCAELYLTRSLTLLRGYAT